MIAGGELGRCTSSTARYLQDWLLEADRLLVAARAGEGRRELRDRRHRIALVRSGAARHRAADRRGARRSDDGDRHAAQAVGVDRGVRQRRRDGAREPVTVTQRGSRDRPGPLRRRREGLRRRSGRSAPGTRTGCGSRSNGRQASVRWAAGAAERAVDRPPRRRATACSPRIRRCSRRRARGYAHLPGGHQEAWAGRLLQRHARCLRLHRRRQAAAAIRVRRRSPPSKTGIIRRASSTPSWRATGAAAVWTQRRRGGDEGT